MDPRTGEVLAMVGMEGGEFRGRYPWQLSGGQRQRVLFALALALTWLYERTDNLLAPITAHALFNAANYMVLLWQKSPSHA